MNPKLSLKILRNPLKSNLLHRNRNTCLWNGRRNGMVATASRNWSYETSCSCFQKFAVHLSNGSRDSIRCRELSCLKRWSKWRPPGLESDDIRCVFNALTRDQQLELSDCWHKLWLESAGFPTTMKKKVQCQLHISRWTINSLKCLQSYYTNIN